MLRNLQKNLTGYLLLSIVCAFPYVYAQPQTPKITKIKLENYGWQPIPVRRELFGHRVITPNLWFDHENRVLVGFTVRANYGLATREHPGRILHILRFPAEDKSDLSLSLPTDNWDTNGFYLSPTDQILARANETLQSFSKDGSDEQSGTWRPLASCSASCVISQSFSRRTLILRVKALAGSHEGSSYTVLDVSSSPPRVVITCSQMASMRITDEFAYRTDYDRDDDLTVRFPFCDLEHYEEFPQWGKGGWRYLLNDETLLKIGPIKDGQFRAEVVGVEGKVKFSKETPKPDYIYPYEVATDERYDRFAFMVNTEQGEHPNFDIVGHLVARRVEVLDETGKILASIPLDTHYHNDSDFSMSPDGHRLAILDQGVVTVVDLK